MPRGMYTNSRASNNLHFTTQINENTAVLTNNININLLYNYIKEINTQYSYLKVLQRKVFDTNKNIFPNIVVYSQIIHTFALANRTGCSSARLEYASGGRVVAGSNPVIPTEQKH